MSKKILDLLNIVNLLVSCPSNASMKASFVSKSHNKKVYKPGGIVFCDSKHFNPFMTAKRAVERASLARGTRLYGGYAMTDESAKALLPELKLLDETVKDAKLALVNIWPRPVEEWAAENPEDADVIRAAAPTAGKLAESIKTTPILYKATSMEKMLADAGMEDGLTSAVSNIGSQIVDEIATEVNSVKYLFGKDNVIKIPAVLARVRQKAAGLVLIDSKMRFVVKLIDDVLLKLPKSGKIEGSDFLVLKGLLDVLSDQDAMMSGTELSVEIDGTDNEGQLVIDPILLLNQAKSKAPASSWNF